MALLAYFALYIYLHACAARPLMVSDKETVAQIQLSSKDVKTLVDERFLKHGDDKASYDDANVMQSDNQKFSSAENIEGKKVKTSHTWKILQQPTGTETWKRADRSTLESSPPSNAKENVHSKDNDTVGDIDVMDYAQPHRKPPIHNRGT